MSLIDTCDLATIGTSPAAKGFAARAMRKALACRVNPDSILDCGCAAYPGCFSRAHRRSKTFSQFGWMLLFLMAPVFLTLTITAALAFISPIGTFNSAVELQQDVMIASLSATGAVRVNNFG